jgi:nickel transport protein
MPVARVKSGVAVAAIWLWSILPAFGHGTVVEADLAQAISVTARYDSGTPMMKARVTVFAPDDPTQPWLTGRTDSDGRFLFMPGDQTGRWAIEVRQAGHGATAYIYAERTGVHVADRQPAGSSPAQRLLMVASVLWGCIGTALYAMHRRKGRAA